jgi:hypothetical protein
MRETAQTKQDQLTDDKAPITLSPLALRWGPIYRSYTAHAWYRSPLLLLQRVLFTLSSVLLATDSSRFGVYGFLNMTSLLLHVFVQPFEQPRMNRVGAGAYILLIYLSIALTLEDAPYSIGIRLLLAVLVIPFAIRLFLWTSKHQVERLKERCQRKGRGGAAAVFPGGHSDSEHTEIASSSFSSSSSSAASIEMKPRNSNLESVTDTRCIGVEPAGVTAGRSGRAAVRGRCSLVVRLDPAWMPR